MNSTYGTVLNYDKYSILWSRLTINVLFANTT